MVLCRPHCTGRYLPQIGLGAQGVCHEHDQHVDIKTTSTAMQLEGGDNAHMNGVVVSGAVGWYTIIFTFPLGSLLLVRRTAVH